jgi:hypothetical protein
MLRIHRVLTMASFFLLPWCAQAHDIPNDVTVQAFVKPEGAHLRLLVRVPLRAMRDISFPERSAGYLDLTRAGELLPSAATLWISDFIEIYEGDVRLPKPRVIATRISLPSDHSFACYEDALAHVTGAPLPDTTNISWDQTMLDVLFDYPIQSERSRFSIHPGLARMGLRVMIALRFLPPSGVVRAFEFEGDPGLVSLDPRWHQAALRFVGLGFLHILSGTDHLLFIFCLVIPFRRLRTLITGHLGVGWDEGPVRQSERRERQQMVAFVLDARAWDQPRRIGGAGDVLQLGARLREGRFFDASDRRSSSPVAIVNETFANRHLPGRSAVGTRFQYGQLDDKGYWYTIVGVVKEIRERSVEKDSGPAVYLLHEQTDQWSTNGAQPIAIVVRTAVEPASLVPVIRQAMINTTTACIIQPQRILKLIAKQNCFMIKVLM